MTLGKIHEIIASLACLYDNDKQRVDATAFRSFDITYYQNILEKNGFDKNAEFKMANADGTILSCPVYCGPCYYQALRHHVVDKFQVRSTGSIMPETHQPLKGRANDGGLRFGEMERDALISSGAAYLLSERLMYSSDQFTTEYCLTCGNLVNPPINNVPQECKVCRERGDTPKFGVVTIPYIFLLIMRMLSAMGLHTTLKLKDVSKFSENNNFQIIE
jgi:DNA-directed RNA polymerase beta subunit